MDLEVVEEWVRRGVQRSSLLLMIAEGAAAQRSWGAAQVGTTSHPTHATSLDPAKARSLPPNPVCLPDSNLGSVSAQQAVDFTLHTLSELPELG